MHFAERKGPGRDLVIANQQVVAIKKLQIATKYDLPAPTKASQARQVCFREIRSANRPEEVPHVSATAATILHDQRLTLHGRSTTLDRNEYLPVGLWGRYVCAGVPIGCALW